MTEYYSIQFEYPAAVRGWSDGDENSFVHIAYAVDEDAESRLLSKVERIAYNAARSVGLQLQHEYCYPDGSCFKYTTTETATEFEAKFARLCRILASPWMSIRIRASHRHFDDPASANSCGECYLNLIERIAKNPLPYERREFKPKDPLNSYGGMSHADWARYRERNAFKDGFLAAFGHYTDFWHGGHPGYVPTERAQEQAGIAYHLGLLLKLVNYG